MNGATGNEQSDLQPEQIDLQPEEYNLQPEEYDLTGTLPSGTLLLEASAGTGKTYTMAGLAVRYIAEGACSLPELLLITFTRAATGELRERVRERLASTVRDLTDERPSDDPIVEVLRRGSRPMRAERQQRLRDALATFERASIATTHSFCQETLAALGLTADTDPLESFITDTTDLDDGVVTDMYLATYPDDEPPAGMNFAKAKSIARAALGDPLASLDAGPVVAGQVCADRQMFAERVRAESLRRRRMAGSVTYDDLITRVDAAVHHPVTGDTACRLLRERYSVVMVDEFQDTDPLQWRILQRAFHGHSTLVLIGDPKQAIYAFRGGDVATYLTAQRCADRQATLMVNHRTDSELVAEVSDLFRDIDLGDPRIRVRPVTSRHHRRRVNGGVHPAPLRVRTLPDVDGSARMETLRALVSDDLTQDIATMIASGTTIVTADGERPVEPRDIAVIVDRNADADRVHDALRTAGINAVVTGTQNVFSTPAAKHWLTVLHALANPQRPELVRTAMITPPLGYQLADLVLNADVADRAAADLRTWAARFPDSGIAGVLGGMAPRMTPTILARPDGERMLTDVRHIAEELHAASRVRGLAGLITWLRQRIADSARDSEQAARRLDIGADAVQILTIHSSKGLEFPITYLPFLWSRWVDRDPDTLRLHDDSGRRVLDVRGRTGPHWSHNRQRHLLEDSGESLRKAYVAMTRASSRVTMWWLPSRTTASSPLQRLLGARLEGHEAPSQTYTLTLAQVEQALGFPVEVASPPAAAPSVSSPAPAPPLTAATYSRTVDTSWRRTSYSAITAAAHESAYLDDTEHLRKDDEPEGAVTDDPSLAPRTHVGQISPMADLPTGTTFGLIVHKIYETFDPDVADPAAHLCSCAADALRDRPIPDLDPATLATAMMPSLTTPLGTLTDNRDLSAIAAGDRLTELDFELPLAGGDHPRRPATVADLAGCLSDHLPTDDDLGSYPDHLTADPFTGQRLVGFLAGSIDAVLRVGTPARPRFVVADYKTNWIGGSLSRRILHAQDYSRAAMADAMMTAHYPLQALLYQVALHRYLRWRLPHYDPATHLGGVLYLFVRGMCGADTEVDGDSPYGVFDWRPPPALIADVSDLLRGRS